MRAGRRRGPGGGAGRCRDKLPKPVAQKAAAAREERTKVRRASGSPALEEALLYKITTGIHIHFAHHIRGHAGPCVSIHGHTWKFDVTLVARELDAQGFVIDFDDLNERVLMPCHRLLDHSLALGEQSYIENREALAQLGSAFVETRRETLGHLGTPQAALDDSLGGARNERPGGIKVAVFPFSPTSERLARWLYDVADGMLRDGRVRVAAARIYETLLPTEAVAEYVPLD
jgi:6-pyruvoyl-tetrahydropterin synthase